MSTTQTMDKKSENPLSLFDQFEEELNNELLRNDVSNDRKSSVNDVFKTDDVNLMTVDHQNTDLDESYNNRHIMFKSFDEVFETNYDDNKVSFIPVQQISEELHSNCVCMVNVVQNKKPFVEIKRQRSKFISPKNKPLTSINKLQCQIMELNLQLKHHSTFSSMIGATFGYHLWKATQIPVVANMVLQGDKMINMAKLMISILTTFIETYNVQPIKTYDIKFVLNILGIVANLTTTKAGCHFFSQMNDGISVINLIMSMVIYAPSSLNNNFKRIAYAALYNVSIHFNAHLLMENNALIKTLHNDIKVTFTKDINDTVIFALKLLHSLTRNISKSMYIILKNEIHVHEILKLTKYTQTELIARKIYENLNVANQKYNEFEEI